MMKRLVALLFASAAWMGVHAQQMEELTSWEQTYKSRLTGEQLEERSNARLKEEGLQPDKNGKIMTMRRMDEPLGKKGLDILPDTLYGGEPFEVHYAFGSEGEATYELYDLSEKRPKRMMTKHASPLINGYTVMRITLDEPGSYEVVVYDAANPMGVSDLEMMKSRWKITVHDRKAPASE